MHEMVGFCSELRSFQSGTIGLPAGERRNSVLHIPSFYAGIDLRSAEDYLFVYEAHVAWDAENRKSSRSCRAAGLWQGFRRRN